MSQEELDSLKKNTLVPNALEKYKRIRVKKRHCFFCKKEDYLYIGHEK